MSPATDNLSIMERGFWRHVQRGEPDECWPWTYMSGGGGYGKCRIGRYTGLAHRISYEIANGPLPAPIDGEPTGHYVLHTCHNRLCCNPAHLVVGSAADNHRMMMDAGRAVFRNGPQSASGFVVNGVEFPSLMAASRATGISRGSLRGAAKKAGPDIHYKTMGAK